jgi:hypothetical protein
MASIADTYHGIVVCPLCNGRSSGDETEKNKCSFIEIAALKTINGSLFFEASLQTQMKKVESKRNAE